jgi:hypothetical protein
LHGQLTSEAAGSGLNSHHVPQKGLSGAIVRFLKELADELAASGEWTDDPAGQAVARALAERAQKNEQVTENDLSAILLSSEAHTEEGGVHTAQGAGPIRLALATNPRRKRLMLARRKTIGWIAASGIPGSKKVASFLSVSPQRGNWKIFLADVKRSFTDERLAFTHNAKPVDDTAVDLLLADAEREGAGAGAAAEEHLQSRLVRPTTALLHRAVKSSYFTDKSVVKEVLNQSGFGSKAGRARALSELDAYFRESWQQFRDPIDVDYPTEEADE